MTQKRGLSSMMVLPPDFEQLFQRDMQFTAPYVQWRNEFAKRFGEQPNINSPEYDYRAAWASGAAPQPYGFDGGMYHWPSQTSQGRPLKAPDHPTAWMETFMKKYGVDPHAANAQQLMNAYRTGVIPKAIPGMGGK